MFSFAHHNNKHNKAIGQWQDLYKQTIYMETHTISQYSNQNH